MKFCVIGPTWPFRGGIAHFTTLLVKHLRERHDVRFISYLKQYPKFLYPGNTALDPSPEASTIQVQTDRVLTPIDPLTWYRTFRMVQREKPDVLLLQWWTPYFSPFLFFLTRLLRYFHKAPMRTVFICHHMIEPDGGIFDWFLARRILRHGDAFIVMSEEEFGLMRRAFPHKTIKGTLLPPFDGVSGVAISQTVARQELNLPAGEKVLLFFGFVRHYKGLRYLIEALPEVRKHIAVRLLIVGEFWEDERPYRELIKKLGLEACVTIFNKYIANDKVTNYFSAADLVVMPYLKPTQSGIAQLAIGFERPMVATNVGGMPEMIRHNETGLIVPPADSAELAKAIITFFTENMQERFVTNLRAGKESLSWQPMVQLIEALGSEPESFSSQSL
jgi:glycosyltransferase involved in cell wall biosynthesis